MRCHKSIAPRLAVEDRMWLFEQWIPGCELPRLVSCGRLMRSQDWRYFIIATQLIKVECCEVKYSDVCELSYQH
jgi:hypothetical protein